MSERDCKTCRHEAPGCIHCYGLGAPVNCKHWQPKEPSPELDPEPIVNIDEEIRSAEFSRLRPTEVIFPGIHAEMKRVLGEPEPVVSEELRELVDELSVDAVTERLPCFVDDGKGRCQREQTCGNEDCTDVVALSIARAQALVNPPAESKRDLPPIETLAGSCPDLEHRSVASEHERVGLLVAEVLKPGMSLNRRSDGGYFVTWASSGGILAEAPTITEVLELLAVTDRYVQAAAVEASGTLRMMCARKWANWIALFEQMEPDSTRARAIAAVLAEFNAVQAENVELKKRLHPRASDYPDASEFYPAPGEAEKDGDGE